MNYSLSHLEELEAEAIYIIREAAALCQKPVILFSGGKDSILLSILAVKAFQPAKVPFPLLHIDTGHNFEETIQYRDWFVNEYNMNLVVASVEDDIVAGKIEDDKSYNSGRNKLQTYTLLSHISKNGYDAALGGGRRDEEKARAKERIFSHRDEFGQWDPKNQRPELWNLFNAKKKTSEHFRIFPISNWTELDVWQYLAKENIVLPTLYFAHQRMVIDRGDILLADSEFLIKKENEIAKLETVRCRTIGDLTSTGVWRSTASSIEEVIDEIFVSKLSERGGRADDKFSETAMEDRKREGYF